jgi:beta-N-acetylhexosaminidase
MGIWQLLTGGPFTFGFSINSTRLFMLMVSVVSAVLVYKIAEGLTKKTWLGLLAAIIFAFSPLSIYFHRRVLLDNLESLWVLVSFWLLVRAKSNLWNLAISGGLFGLAFLSKESAIFLFPAMLYSVWVFCRKENRLFGVLMWLVTAVFVMGAYPFVAIVRGEFFPPGWFGDIGDHVSLLGALAFQLGRAGGQPLAAFWGTVVDSWWYRDPLLVILGAWALLFGCWGMLFKREVRAVLLLSVSYLVFLMRAGTVLGFYVVPLLPFLIILFVQGIDWISQRVKYLLRGSEVTRVGVLLALGLALVAGQAQNLFLTDETGPQVRSIKYVKNNVDPQAFLAVDDIAVLDLRLPTSDGPAFPGAHWFSKVEHDTAVQGGILGGRWENINYILLSHEMLRTLTTGTLPFLAQAYGSTRLIADFPPQSKETYRDLNKKISTNGDWAMLLSVEVPIDKQLSSSALGDVFKNDELMRRVDEAISRMNLQEKVGQQFWVSISGTKIDSDNSEFLQSLRPGGILLLGENITSEKSLVALATDVGNMDFGSDLARPILAVDEEGGLVVRIPFESQDYVYQADVKDASMAVKVAELRGDQMRLWGVGVNLAPVADISWSQDSTVARERRNFVGDGEKVAELVTATINGYKESGIMPVVKHFPGGFGRTQDDSHVSLPKVDVDEAGLADDLLPFKKAIEAGVGGVMVGHLLYPQIDPKVPASMSEVFINQILRKQLGFGGVVVVDDISMGALAGFSQEKVLESAIKAGADVVIITGTAQEELAARDTLMNLVIQGKISEKRINESLERILRFKSGFLE